jgi:hypothetical protein
MPPNPKDEKFDVDAALKSVKETIEQPDKFAEVFCNAAETQTKVKKVIRDEIYKSIDTDADCKDSLKKIIREVEKEAMFFFGKKIGFAAWSIGLIIIGAVAGAIVSKIIQ